MLARSSMLARGRCLARPASRAMSTVQRSDAHPSSGSGKTSAPADCAPAGAAPKPSRHNVLSVLRERGLLTNHTSSVEHLSSTLGADEPVCVYAGFDPTADSLHAGNLLVLMGLLHFQRAGHRTIALVGGATGQVGDPSGRSTQRQAMEVERVGRNALGIQTCMQRVFENSRQQMPPSDRAATFDIQVVNNLDWYSSMSALDFVRNVGQHFRVSSMLAKESVKARLAPAASASDSEGMSFTEFSYQIFQAYDFYHLFQSLGCSVQLGGSDQWGNITGGCDLIRKLTGKEAFGITLPLVTTSSGEKFGKSMGNAVWMDKTKTTYLDWYQFFIRTEDKDVERFLKFFTFLPLENVADIMRVHRSAPEKRVAQRELANHVTELVHGPEGASQAKAATALMYGTGGSLADAGTKEFDLSKESIQVLLDSKTPQFFASDAEGRGVRLVDCIVGCGLAGSKNEARKLISNGGVSVNNVKATSEVLVLDPSRHMLHSGITVLKVGKKNFGLVVWKTNV